MQSSTPACCFLIGMLTFMLGCTSKDTTMNDRHPNLELTDEEQTALKQDELLVQAARQFNEQQGTSDKTFAELFPNAIPVSDVLYWSLIDRPDARARLKQAIANGADINEKGENGYTALHGAAENNVIENVKLLLANYADPNATTDDGKTPLDLAEHSGHDGVVAVLKAQFKGSD
jgi:ankyrin repeat protein